MKTRTHATALLFSLSLTACGGGDAMTLPPTEADRVIQETPADNPGADAFPRFATAFGVYVLATEDVSDADLLWAVNVMAQYLDDNEDGTVDAPEVVQEMTARSATIVMFETEREARFFRNWDLLDGLAAQDLYGEETHPSDRFDASLEEVLHLVTHVGWSNAWPDSWAETTGSEVAEAMDLARGGHFEEMPDSYPDEAWYHYDDDTCDYGCMITEYVYWATTTWLGAQANRCDEIAHEWEPCTPEALENTDPTIHALLQDERFRLPTLLPDGSYGE